MAEVMGVIVPMGKRKISGGKAAGFPKKSSFIFTEDHALKKIVRRMMKECPAMCSNVSFLSGGLIKVCVGVGISTSPA